MRLESYSLSDVGRQRQRNEDCCYANSGTGLFIVADGMGGHPAGDVASRMAVEVLREQLEAAELCAEPERIPERLDAALKLANQRLIAAGEKRPEWRRMGTTASLAIFCEGRAFICNVGDSRIYLLRNGEFSQYSEDHNPTDPALFGGKVERLSNILTQALGTGQPLAPFQQQVPLQPADRLLLCTDGLNNLLTDQVIAQLLKQQQNQSDTCRALVRAANEKGGYDNITVIVVDVLS